MIRSLPPRETLAKVRSTPADATLIVDLDHTLHLGNSTEDFIDLAVPASIAATGLALLEAVRPWRWRLDPVASRDHWRVALVAVFLPWTVIRWRRRSRASQMWNKPLLAAVKAHPGRVVIASNGFRLAVGPRVGESLPNAEIVARSLSSTRPRHNDKAERVIDRLGVDVVATATVVTDSEDDLELLEACAQPLLTVWPDSSWNGALNSAYVPLRYTAAKHGKRSLFWAIFMDDLPLILLVTVVGANSPIRAAISSIALLIGLRCVYDSGYHENDHLPNDSEPEPNVRHKALELENSVPSLPVALWATSAAALSVLVADTSDLVAPSSVASTRRVFGFLIAICVLAVLRIVFAGFNRQPMRRRRWTHPLIQACRYGIFAAIYAVSPAGQIALASQAVYRIVPYWIYRSGRTTNGFPSGPWSIMRLAVFVVLLSAIWPLDGRDLTVGLAVLAWFAIRSFRDLRHILEKGRIRVR